MIQEKIAKYHNKEEDPKVAPRVPTQRATRVLALE